MLYEVNARLYFEIEDEAKDFYHDCELAMAKSTIINPGDENQEASAIQILQNHHDVDPNEPCVLLGERHNAPS